MAIVLPKFPRRRLSARRLKRAVEPALGLRLLSLQPRLEPLELLEFEYSLRRVEFADVDRLEVSVVWQTEGKGSEDFGVHYFESLNGAELARAFEDGPKSVSTTLPANPLTYSGHLLSIKWCIRLRLYMNDNREIAAEQPFYLGHLTVDV